MEKVYKGNVGNIIKIFPQKGFGFICHINEQNEEINYYFHMKNLIKGTRFDFLRIGDELMFDKILSKEESFSGKGDAVDKVYAPSLKNNF